MNSIHTDPASANPSVSAPTPLAVTVIKSAPTVHLAVADAGGSVVCLMGGTNRVLADLLVQYEKLRDPAGGSAAPVEKITGIAPIGQDCYNATWDFVMFSRAAMLTHPWGDIVELERKIPKGMRYTFVVTY